MYRALPGEQNVAGGTKSDRIRVEESIAWGTAGFRAGSDTISDIYQ